MSTYVHMCSAVSLGTSAHQHQSASIPSLVESPTKHGFSRVKVRKVVLLWTLDPWHRTITQKCTKGRKFHRLIPSTPKPVSVHCHQLQTQLSVVIKDLVTWWHVINLTNASSPYHTGPIKAATITMETSLGRNAASVVKPSQLLPTESSRKRGLYLSENGDFFVLRDTIASSHCFLPVKLKEIKKKK